MGIGWQCTLSFHAWVKKLKDFCYVITTKASQNREVALLHLPEQEKHSYNLSKTERCCIWLPFYYIGSIGMVGVGTGADACACTGSTPVFTIGLTHFPSKNAAGVIATPVASAPFFNISRRLIGFCELDVLSVIGKISL